MANAKRCDRCKRFYENYNEEKDEKKINSIIPANVSDDRRYWAHNIIELCPECMDEFSHWMNKVEGTQEKNRNIEGAEEFKKFMMQRFMRKD